jgi:hypothetical protein
MRIKIWRLRFLSPNFFKRRGPDELYTKVPQAK